MEEKVGKVDWNLVRELSREMVSDLDAATLMAFTLTMARETLLAVHPNNKEWYRTQLMTSDRDLECSATQH